VRNDWAQWRDRDRGDSDRDGFGDAGASGSDADGGRTEGEGSAEAGHRDSSFARRRGIRGHPTRQARIPDSTSADMGSKICPRARVQEAKSARGTANG
jgi:hypothetical protein